MTEKTGKTVSDVIAETLHLQTFDTVVEGCVSELMSADVRTKGERSVAAILNSCNQRIEEANKIYQETQREYVSIEQRYEFARAADAGFEKAEETLGQIFQVVIDGQRILPEQRTLFSDYMTNYAGATLAFSEACEDITPAELRPWYEKMGPDKVSNCGQLITQAHHINSTISFSQLWGSLYRPRDTVYASLAYVNNTLRRPDAPKGYETFYSMMDYSVGYMVQMHGGPWLTGSGVPVELGLSHIAGAMENNGSRQTELVIRAGWRQQLPYNFFVQPKLSVGNAWHALNYGEGLEPQKGHSLVFGGNIVAGYSLPLQTIFTIDLSAGYLFEVAVPGDSYHLNYGPMFQVTPRQRWPFTAESER